MTGRDALGSGAGGRVALWWHCFLWLGGGVWEGMGGCGWIGERVDGRWILGFVWDKVMEVFVERDIEVCEFGV